MTTARRPARVSWILAPLLGAVAAIGSAGCALTAKSEASVLRYFSPERPGGRLRPAPPSVGAPSELRLGRISGAAHLDERLVYRESTHELGYYQERRWTEAPDQYLKRRLARVLFEERGLRRVVAGGAPTLDVELVAFEEIRGPRPAARVEVVARLQDQRAVRWEETLTVEQPVAGPAGGGPAEGMVEALGVALEALVDRIAERVVKDLAAPAVASGGPPAPPLVRDAAPR